MTRTGKHYEFREYYVVFGDSYNLPWWWRLFTRKGFEHCHLFISLNQDESLCVCQNMSNVEITHYKHNVHALADRLAAERDRTVVYLPRIVGDDAKVRLGSIIPTCVAMCQRYTGLTFHAFTPYYYYKALLRAGGFLISKDGGVSHG